MTIFSHALRKTKVIETQVPGGKPIPLFSYYSRFRDYYPSCEMQSKRWLVENAGEDWVSIDAGANIGYYSILLSRLSPGGKVFAFEPTSTVHKLKANLKHNGTHNVEIIESALGSYSGERVEEIHKIWGTRPDRRRYSFTTIDDFVASRKLTRLDFVKIDVDGFDVEVLEGARETISRFEPAILIELNHALAGRNYTISDALQFLQRLRYGSALILDKENYLFAGPSRLGEPWPEAVAIGWDTRDPAMDNEVELVGATQKISPRLWELQNNSVRDGGRIKTSGPAWDYCLAINIPPKPRPSAVILHLEVSKGKLGVFVTDDEAKQILGKESIINTGEESDLILTASESASKVILRKITGEDAIFGLHSVAISAVRSSKKTPTKLLNETSRESLEETLGTKAQELWQEVPLAQVSRVTSEELSNLVGSPQAPPRPLSLFDPANHLMEISDAPIIAEIIRSIRPEWHLEIGTWEGFGTALALRSGARRVVTVNLSEGETKDDSPVYKSSRYPHHLGNPQGYEQSSDSADSIGWIYRFLGHEARVEQVLGDSKNLQASDFSGMEISTCLVDGSHDREGVRADLQFVSSLMNNRGVIMLHDFSLDLNYVNGQPSTVGVIAAVADTIQLLSETRRWVWVDGTMLLVGIPRR